VSGQADGAVISVVVADDHEVVRAGFAALLDTQPDFTVLGTASDGAQAVAVCLSLRPDVVLMDIRMHRLLAELTPGSDTHTSSPSGHAPLRPGRTSVSSTSGEPEVILGKDATAVGAVGK
jgi:DNA-binding NarL/FixJ family response regulator